MHSQSSAVTWTVYLEGGNTAQPVRNASWWLYREESLEGRSACPVTIEPSTRMVGIQWCRCQSWGTKFPVGKWHVLSSLLLWRVSGPFCFFSLFVPTSRQIPSQFHFHLRNCSWFLLFIIRTLTSIIYFGFKIYFDF